MSLANHMTAVEDRQLPLRKRADLEISESTFQLEKSWIVKDPVSLKYHRLREAEMIVLGMLDGPTTLRQIKEALQDKYPTKIARLTDLQQLLSSLFRAGMLLSDSPGQAEQLLKRHRETKRRELTGRLSNVLAIKFPGFDPERILSWLHPRLGWIFDRAGMIVWMILAVSAGSLLLTNLDEFQRRLPGFYEFFTASNFFWLALVMAVTKIGHEFGHGLSCKHFGGECHEIGFMLLVFTPALYCDTSDSWLLPNKWHRAFIGAAGMYVEVFLASVATFLWWYTQPGLFNFMCLNVMFVSSISTVVFNANPLLRYDGYYILSDILEIPNLSQKSRLAMLNILRVTCLGMKPVSPRQLPQRNHVMFAAYSVASFLYRWFVLIMIVWFVSRVFEPYGLKIIGHLIIGMSAIGLVIMPFWKLGKFFSVPGRIQEVKKPRLIASFAVVGLFAAGVCFLPLPHRVMTSVVIRPDGAERVYVSVSGGLEKVLVQPGDQVQSGDVLAELSNSDAELRYAMLDGEKSRQINHLENLKRRQLDEPTVRAQVPIAEAALHAIETQLERLEEDNRRLILVANQPGTILPPPEIHQPPPSGQLTGWSGSPFDEQNDGAFLETGTLFCSVGDPIRMKALLVIDQTNIERIKAGQQVEILLDEYPLRTMVGRIREVAKIDLKLPPRELMASSGGPIATQTDPATGEPKSMFVMYEATVPLHDLDRELLNGFRGKAKIEVGKEPLATKALRFIRNSMHFR